MLKSYAVGMVATTPRADPRDHGLWQVTGRSEEDFDEWVRLDMRYARQQCLLLDLKLLLTIPAVLIGRGAY